MTLAPIKTPRKWRDFVTYDLEWLPSTMGLRVVGAYDRQRGYRYYDTVKQFFDREFTHENRGRWFYAHAGGLADISYVIDAIRDMPEYHVSACFSGSSAIIVTITRGHNSWYLLDSYWLLHASLATIGDAIGLPKLDCAWDAPIAQLLVYNERDCRILYDAIDRFQNVIHDLGGELKMTLASTALNLFGRVYLTKPIPTHGYVNDHLRPSYVGGRVEVHAHDAAHGNYFDICSSYPAAMCEPLPGGFKRFHATIPNRSDALIFATAEVRIRDCKIPPIPMRMSENSVYYPTGVIAGTFTGDELHAIEEGGHQVLRVTQVLEFYPLNAFKRYILDLYALRQKAIDADDGYMSLVLKLLMNSTYGKFGEKSEKRGLILNPSASDLKRLKLEALFPGAFISIENKPVRHEHIPLAAYVTGRGRVNIWRYMLPAKDVHYCDTDGFSCMSTIDEMPICNDPGRPPDENRGVDLGKLKWEMSFEEASYAASKLYAHKGIVKPDAKNPGKFKKVLEQVKAKGFTGHDLDPNGNTKRRQLNTAEYDALLRGAPHQAERMVRIMEAFREHDTTPRTVHVEKVVRNTVLPKRCMSEDGTSSRPWTVAELESGKAAAEWRQASHLREYLHERSREQERLLGYLRKHKSSHSEALATS